MNRIEFIIVTAIILFVAFALGWFAHWVIFRFTRVTKADLGELERLAQALHEAEETRDQAVAYIHHREEELNRELTQTRAELRAAMDGLREARYEVDLLQRQLEARSDG
ncbi:hypothetical protein [Pararhodobacter sp.]|jgi:prophage endopeptidase|uniref:hypothetical protein n=1 Tax=Pararhodobacter sp. TaxID=2127056 RepID=UPI002FDEC473